MPRSGEKRPLKQKNQAAKISPARRRSGTSGARLILGIEECECKRAGLWRVGQFAGCTEEPSVLQPAFGGRVDVRHREL